MTWYPAQDSNLHPTLRFSNEERQTVASKLKGTPVVWNHAGTDAHVATGISFEQLATVNPVSGPVGVVKEAWVGSDGAGHAIISVNGSTGKLVGTPAAPAVSLSHTTTSESELVPVELSLVNKPARKGAVVNQLLTTPSSENEYKATTLQLGIANTMESNPPATEQPTPLESALASLDEPTRKLVTDRMAEMAQVAQEKSATVDSLQAELEANRRVKETDAAATKQAIDLWIKSLGPEIADRWQVASCATDSKTGQFPSHAVRAMVCASHERMAQLTSSKPAAPPAAAPAAKRQRTAEPAPPQSSSQAPSDPLRAALASTFNVGNRML